MKKKYCGSDFRHLITIYNINRESDANDNILFVGTEIITLQAKIETITESTKRWNGIVVDNEASHRIIVNWNPRLLPLTTGNINEIRTNDVLIIKKTNQKIKILSIVNEDEMNRYIVIIGTTKGLADNQHNAII